MDSYLTIISLALAIATLVPILSITSRPRFWVVMVGALSLVVLIGVYRTYEMYAREKEVIALKGSILDLLSKNERGMTFDQINDNLYYPNYQTVNIAIDELVDEDWVLNEKKTLVDGDGAQYVIRKYFRRF